MEKKLSQKQGPESNLWPAADCRFGCSSTSFQKQERKKGSETKFNGKQVTQRAPTFPPDNLVAMRSTLHLIKSQ